MKNRRIRFKHGAYLLADQILTAHNGVPGIVLFMRDRRHRKRKARQYAKRFIYAPGLEAQQALFD